MTNAFEKERIEEDRSSAKKKKKKNHSNSVSSQGMMIGSPKDCFDNNVVSTSGRHVPTTLKKHMTATQQMQKQPILLPGSQESK